MVKNANKKKNQAMKVILVMLKVNRSIVPGGSSYYEDDEPVDKPKKVTKKAKCKIKINTVKVAESSSDENSSESLDSPVSKCKKKKEKCKLQPKKGSKAVVPQNVK